MNSREFVYWLQGFMEISDDPSQELDSIQVKTIKEHLAMVFQHEIYPEPKKDIDVVSNAGGWKNTPRVGAKLIC